MGNGAMAKGPQATAPILDSTRPDMQAPKSPVHPKPGLLLKTRFALKLAALELKS